MMFWDLRYRYMYVRRLMYPVHVEKRKKNGGPGGEYFVVLTIPSVFQFFTPLAAHLRHPGVHHGTSSEHKPTTKSKQYVRHCCWPKDSASKPTLNSQRNEYNLHFFLLHLCTHHSTNMD